MTYYDTAAFQNYNTVILEYSNIKITKLFHILYCNIIIDDYIALE